MFFSFPNDFKISGRPGVTMYQITGDKLALSYGRKEADPNYDPQKQVGPGPHSHDGQEQIIIVLKGEVSYTVGGQTRLLKPMDALIIPPGVTHTADPGAGESEVIEIVSPPSAPHS